MCAIILCVLVTLLCLIAEASNQSFFPVLCGCHNNQCTSCCGIPKDNKYVQVWESDFTKLEEQWDIITYDPSGNQGSAYVNDGTTFGILNDGSKRLFIKVVEKKPRPASGPRYNSGRLETKDTFTYGLFIAKTSHVPRGCGMWPAIWMYGIKNKFGSWPVSGELDLLETINDANFLAASMNYGSCERGQYEWDSYCRHRSKNIWGAEGTSDGSTFAMEWDPNYIKFFHWTPSTAPPDLDSPNPDNWISQNYGTFWRANTGHNPAPHTPIPPYSASNIDGVMGFVCPTIGSNDDPKNYDYRCHPGDMYCPGADKFVNMQNGSGCDFTAPFGNAVCDQPGMRLSMNVKVCGIWPAGVPPGDKCCTNWQHGYPDLNDLDGHQLIVDYVKVYQKKRTALNKLCCPLKDAPDDLMQKDLDWICSPTGGNLECSPINWGGLYYFPLTVYDHARWAFNSFFQRNMSPDDCSNKNTSHIIEGGSSCPKEK